jgi:hypothetical protein
MDPRDIAIALARGRIAFGAAAMVAPGLASRLMLGADGSRPGTRLFARMIGGRDMALGLGVVIALDRGAPVRGWLEAGALADGVDLIGCLLARNEIPRSTFASVAPLAAGAALAGIWLSRQLDPPPPADPGHPEAVATGHPSERVEASSAAD